MRVASGDIAVADGRRDGALDNAANTVGRRVCRRGKVWKGRSDDYAGWRVPTLAVAEAAYGVVPLARRCSRACTKLVKRRSKALYSPYASTEPFWPKRA